MSGIFVSYRRDDTAGHAGRLYDLLRAHFGADQVFMDVDAILPGQDFARVLSESVASCDALLAIIGRTWLTIRNDAGTRRLDDPTDYVRLEIAAALERGIPVVPVLMQGAAMPREVDLPPALAPLARFQALSVSDERFHAEAEDLVRALEAVTATSTQAGAAKNKGIGAPVRARRRGLIAGALVLAGLAGAAVIWTMPRRRRPVVPLKSADLTGRWIADVPIERGGSFRIALKLQSVDDKLLGTVTYPTGIGDIREGSVKGDRVSFITVHLPQFESQEATTRYEGRYNGEALELVMQGSGTVYRFVAKRAKQ